ncbi:DNA (cytosine-5-)-methyltransferase [Propioniciclava sinopodophylli]|uniref:DNA (cytosine-5-)-methyltransferase n=1 Tax=Propioniciclava sinopodophylli TaxID=1837344 RepID=UPI002492B28E|nr:DNA (cytosine-5-)-methyltransferase [Propioniciclava sinopodophylli]
MTLTQPTANPLLEHVARTFSQPQIAELTGYSERTVRRWLAGDSTPPKKIDTLLRAELAKAAKPATFSFIDLFAGVGGTRLGFEAASGRCVFTSEWNKFSQQTYLENFGATKGHTFAGDITRVNAIDVPDHDVLIGGFPCQPFSIAGVSKKNALGRPHGFQDETQGTLFFDIARIIDEKRPKAFMLENVKNLASHDKGRTFRTIMRTLQVELGYDVHYQVIDASPWVPQMRKRVFIVGFREGNDFEFADLEEPLFGPTMGDILHPEDGSEAPEGHYTTGTLATVADKYTLTPHLWTYLQNYASKHRAAGNGFGFGLVDQDDVARTLSARYYKDGSEVLVNRGENQIPRRLTPRECARLMGFPDSFKIPVSDTQAYKQFGNSIVVPVVEQVAKMIAAQL